MLAKLLLFYLQTHMQKTPNNAALRNENNMWKWMSLSLIPHEKYSALNTTRKKKKKHLKKRFKFIYVEVSVDFRRNLLKKTKAEDRFQIRKE